MLRRLEVGLIGRPPVKAGVRTALIVKIQVSADRGARKQVNSAGAEAHWVQQALRELLHVDGQAELEDQLLLDLRRLQRAALKEMGSFSIPLDVADVQEKTEEIFEGLGFTEAMRKFGLLASSVPVSKLRQRALDSLREHPLQAFMAIGHIDHEGKPIAQSPGAETNGEQSEEWYRAHSLQGEDIRRLNVIAGIIEPARLVIHNRFQIEERHLAPIAMRSPFVPPSQTHIFTLGLTRYFQGDFISAVHLLISQLEPSMRHILKLNGHNPVRQYDDGTEEDFDLNAMLTHLRPELERIFGVDWVYEIDLLFAGRPGPSLRNDLAHGHVSTGDCFHHSTVYGCWMLYRLCMIFLLPHWDQFAPELAAVE